MWELQVVEISAFPLTWHIAYTTACCYRTSREELINSKCVTYRSSVTIANLKRVIQLHRQTDNYHMQLSQHNITCYSNIIGSRIYQMWEQ